APHAGLPPRRCARRGRTGGCTPARRLEPQGGGDRGLRRRGERRLAGPWPVCAGRGEPRTLTTHLALGRAEWTFGAHSPVLIYDHALEREHSARHAPGRRPCLLARRGPDTRPLRG